MIKKTLSILVVGFAVAASSTSLQAETWVRGYYRSNGTYVQPHYRSNADDNFWNNWTTYPNINPYTGSYGTRLTPSYRNYYHNYDYSNYEYFGYGY